MKVFQDDENTKAGGQEKRGKEKENTLQVTQASSRASARRRNDADGLKSAQTGRSTLVSSSSTHAGAPKETTTTKKQVEETSAAATTTNEDEDDDDVPKNTTRKLSQAFLETEKENTSALRNGTDRFPLAAHAFNGINITSSRGAVDNVAMNAWRVQKENASLKFTLHQMRHEMACLQSVRI